MHDSEPVFTTPRLSARRWRLGDLASLMEVYGDPAAMRYVGDGRPITGAACERWIAVTLTNYRKRGYGMYALVEGDTGNVIGFAGIVHPSEQAAPEVKYALRHSHWGKGLATEAVSGLLRYAHDELGLTRIIATTHPDNSSSHRVLTKVGMERGELLMEVDGSTTLAFSWRK